MLHCFNLMPAHLATQHHPEHADQRPNWLRVLRLLVLLVLMPASLAGCFSSPAPQLSFTNIKGETIAASDTAGEVFLVNFWATSCTTCVKEMPHLVETYKQFQTKGLRLFAVAMQYDRPDYVVHFTETRQLPFDVILDLTGEIAQAYNQVQLTPTTFLIDRQGDIVKTYVGEPDFQELNRLIETKLAEPVNS